MPWRFDESPLIVEATAGRGDADRPILRMRTHSLSVHGWAIRDGHDGCIKKGGAQMLTAPSSRDRHEDKDRDKDRDGKDS